MDTAARDLDAGVERLPDGVQPAKDGDSCAVARRETVAHAIVGKERGMQVDDALWELRDEAGAEDAHPARQYDQVHAEEAQQGRKLLLCRRSLRPRQKYGRQFVLE